MERGTIRALQQADETDNWVMNIPEAITRPLSAYAREPLILVIDVHEERLVWVVRLLAFAHYHVHATFTPLEMLIWYIEHPALPQAVLLGEVDGSNLFLVHRLMQRLARQRGREMPLVFLAAYFPEGEADTRSFSLSSDGCFALLELLWHVVVRNR